VRLVLAWKRSPCGCKPVTFAMPILGSSHCAAGIGSPSVVSCVPLMAETAGPHSRPIPTSGGISYLFACSTDLPSPPVTLLVSLQFREGFYASPFPAWSSVVLPFLSLLPPFPQCAVTPLLTSLPCVPRHQFRASHAWWMQVVFLVLRCTLPLVRRSIGF
jgi:hypothetical protein